jgi:hypothetical protein
MNATKLAIVVFAVILSVSTAISVRISVTSSGTAQLAAQPNNSKLVIADGSDPVPRPWHSIAA